MSAITDPSKWFNFAVLAAPLYPNSDLWIPFYYNWKIDDCNKEVLADLHAKDTVHWGIELTSWKQDYKDCMFLGTEMNNYYQRGRGLEHLKTIYCFLKNLESNFAR